MDELIVLWCLGGGINLFVGWMLGIFKNKDMVYRTTAILIMMIASWILMIMIAVDFIHDYLQKGNGQDEKKK